MSPSNATKAGVTTAGLTNPDLPVLAFLQTASPPPAKASLTYEGVVYTPEQRALLKALAQEILSVYGKPRSDLGKLRALRDWVARIAIHPYPRFHTLNTTNLAVLPKGASWQDVTDLDNTSKTLDDTLYWSSQYALDGFRVLDKLVGLTGREGDALLEKIGPAQYQIRSLDTYRFVLCTFQAAVLLALGDSLGYPGVLVSTIGHDSSAFFVPKYGKWVYMDATYNEDLVDAKTGVPASPAELYFASLDRTYTKKFVSMKIVGPTWDPEVYIDPADSPDATYFGDNHPKGMAALGSRLAPGPQPYPGHSTQFNSPLIAEYPPFNDESHYQRVTDPELAFPKLGVSVAELHMLDGKVGVIELASNVPNHLSFQKRNSQGDWEDIADQDTLTAGSGWQYYRSIDANGNASMNTVLELR